MSAELPVAIVGIGCKFPGGSDSKDVFYEFIRNKGDGMVKPPSDRWDHAEWQGGDDEPGKYNSAMAGFINHIDSFDPLEFGISMKEAQVMDPSLRLALEVAHQALKDSGIDYRGSYTGVYYAQLLTSTGELIDDRYDISNYHGLGKCVALRANRVSFTFDLRGPSLVIDTACSSAATAMHIALSAIRLGDINQALIIGGNTIVHPQHMVSFSKLGVLSSTGSSKSFDALADGYARSEGFGAVLVKRLDKAIAEGDHVYSVITGSSINSNGKGFSPTTPEGGMQVETIIEAYSRAKRRPSEAFYVELHATGTSVGDPIEANAAGIVFSEGRQSNRLLRVGSVKSNMGHTEGCSFLASLIKVSLMLKRKEIVPNIRYNTPNPRIDFTGLKMEVQTAASLEPLTPDFAAPDGKWVASVSSHGIGGSNAHVVLESFERTLVTAPAIQLATAVSHPNPMYLFIFAAATEAGVLRWKDSVVSAYTNVTNDCSLRSLSYDLARLSRSLPVRGFSIGPALSPGLGLSKFVTVIPKVDPKLCLVFAGQGPQHIYMGKTLSSTFRAFLVSVRRCDDILVEKYGQESFLKCSGLFVPGETVNLPENGVWPVRDVVYSIVFMQLAFVDLLQSLGIEYDYVVGHSLGEVAMGYASGYYSKETAIGIAIARAEAMKQAEHNGGMVALGVGVQRAKTMIEVVLRSSKSSGGLWIAAINSPNAVTIAGKQELVDALIQHTARLDQVSAAKLRVTCAFHTPLMEPHEELFKRIAKSAISEGSNVPVARVMSTVDGKWLDRDLDVDYCWDNIRQPVLFGTAIHKIVKEHNDGGVLFVEISPHPVLNVYIDQCGGKSINLIHRPNLKVPTQNTGEYYQFLQGIGQLMIAGFKSISFAKLCASPDGIQDFIKSKLPEHPYNRSLCWGESAAGRSIRLRQRPRPLASSLFRLSAGTHPDLAGHVILDTMVFPASGYLESILENGAMVLMDIRFHRPLVLIARESNPAYVGCVLCDDKWEFRAATTNSFINGNIELDTAFATGSFLLENPQFDPHNHKLLDVDSLLSRSGRSISGEEFYNALPPAYGYRDHFFDYVEEIYEVSDEKSWFGLAYLAMLEIPARAHDFCEKGYVIHPSILDSIIHCASAIFMNMDKKLSDVNDVFLPVKIDAVYRWGSEKFVDSDPKLSGVVWTYIVVQAFAPEGPLKFDYTVANSDHQVFLTIEGFETALAPQSEPNIVSSIGTEERLTVVWQPKDFPSSDFVLSSVVSPDALSSLCSTFEMLMVNAQMAGRHVVRVLDMDQSFEIAKALESSLASLLGNRLLVDYLFAVTSAEDVEAKAGSLQYSYFRPFVVDVLNNNEPEEEHALRLSSFDVLLQTVDPSHVPSDLTKFFEYLVPSGIAFLLVTGPKLTEISNENVMNWRCKTAVLVQQLRGLSTVEVSVAETHMDALIVIRCNPASDETEELPVDDVVVHHFKHGNEGELVEIVKNLPSNSDLWITGDDDAMGIGALGLAACLAAESPEYTVHSLIFENHDIHPEARARIIHALRRSPSNLEQHLKYTCGGDIFVRRLIYGSPEAKDTAISSTLLSSSFTSPIATLENTSSIRTSPIGQLFDPCKTYLLIGGSSELGVRITRWMVSRGARHFVLTSRRGLEALAKMDLMYLHYLRSTDISVEVVAADASIHENMVATINRANKIAPIDGIFLMTVVLRDAMFSHLSQESFNDVYRSKVHVLDTLLSCVAIENLGFLLLFSTIGSVFGNAGQAAYCASQSYLDRMAEILPNTISISLPPITDSGIFKRLVRSMKGHALVGQLARAGISTAQACNVIGDCLVRRIAHYVPIMAIKDIPKLFPTCEPLLYSHLLPRGLVTEKARDPETNTSETPVTLLAAIVGLEPEQISDNSVITSFGLDSLGAVRFSNDLKTNFNLKIGQSELLGSATIGFLNGLLRKADNGLSGLNSDAEHDDDTAKYGAPLTAILNERMAYGETYTTDATAHQYRMWHAGAESNDTGATVGLFHSQGSQHGTAHWSTHEGYFLVITFSAPLDIVRMRHAMAEIIQRHGALRTAFSWSSEGKLKQTIYPTMDFEIEVLDLSDEVHARQSAYEMSLAAHMKPNFQLDRLPLLTLSMFNLGEGEWGFNIVFHHIIMDEPSLGILLRELLNLYLTGSDGLPPPRLHYSDFSDWVFRTSDVRTQLRNQQLKFWAESLKGVQPLQLTLAAAVDESLSPINQIETVIDARALKRYHMLVSEAGVTPFAGFFAAYNVLLFKCSSQATFVVGTIVSQRSIAQLANVIGFLSNIIPIKTTIDASQPFNQYLTAFKTDLMTSWENQDVAYEEIVSQRRDSSSISGYFRHLFVFGGLNLDAVEELELDDIQVQTIIPLPNVWDQYELSLTVHNSNGRVVLQFDDRLFSEETAGRFLNAYVTLIKNLGRDPSVKIHEASATDNEYDCLGVRMSRAGEGTQARFYVKKV